MGFFYKGSHFLGTHFYLGKTEDAGKQNHENNSATKQKR